MATARRTGTNENISTYGGGTRTYQSLSTWEMATDNDLVTATTSEVLECYDDAASFDDNVDIKGATTSASYFRIIRPASGSGTSGVNMHDGTPNNGFNFASTADVAAVLTISESYSQIQDIIVSFSVTSTGLRRAFYIIVNVSSAYYIGCIGYNGVNDGSGKGTGYIQQGGTTSLPSGFINCLAHNMDNDGFVLSADTGQADLCYNCVSTNVGDRGFNKSLSGASVVKNCLSSASGVEDFDSSGWDAASDYNASGDTTAPGTHSRISQTFSFVDSGGDNFKLLPSDEGANSHGTDLSADATFAFDDDIDFITNRAYEISIGFHQVQNSARKNGAKENYSSYGGATRDYVNDLSGWETTTQADLVTNQVTEVLLCYDDAASFADSVVVSGATTNFRYFRRIIAVSDSTTPSLHDGTPNNGVFFDGTSDLVIFTLSEDYAQIQDIIAQLSINSANNRYEFLCHTNTAMRFIGCIAFDGRNAGLGEAFAGFRLGNGNGADNVCVLCLVHNGEKHGFNSHPGAGNTAYLYNCVSVDNGQDASEHGFLRSSGGMSCINCLSTGAGEDDYKNGAGGATASNNASSDTTAFGTNFRVSQTFTFVNSGGDDFHLALTDEGADQHGTDLSGDSVYPFKDDIDWRSIPSDQWPIGFHWPQHSIHEVGARERISTYGGATRDYNTNLSGWEVATGINLINVIHSDVLECYDDSASFSDEDTFDGATTDTKFFRIIRAASGEGHDGTPNNGVTFATTTITGFAVSEDFFSIQNIIFTTSVDSASDVYVIRLNSGGDFALLSGVIIFDASNASGVAHGIGIFSGNNGSILVGCAVINCDNAGIIHDGTTTNIYNCTLVNNGTYGIDWISGTIVAKNCLADNNTTEDFDSGGTYTGAVTNSSGDGSAPGTGSRTSQTFVFENSGGDDFHITTRDGGAQNFGTDLRLDGNFPYSEDIGGSKFLVWDIGINEPNPEAAKVDQSVGVGRSIWRGTFRKA